jgi:hypothetical protein
MRTMPKAIRASGILQAARETITDQTTLNKADMKLLQ